MNDAWSAPRAAAPIDATVRLPGSKSLTNRALILAALADGPSHLRRPLRARDTLLMADALRAVGISVVDDGPDWHVQPGPLHGGFVDVGLAGTVMRFVPPVAALAHGAVTFDGDEYARVRPMWTMIDGLRQLGTTVDDAGRGRLPFTVRGVGQVPGGGVQIDASASSQFVSGLLLAGARYEKGIEVTHIGDAGVPSLPHIAMTVEMLEAAGVSIERPTPTSWAVSPSVIRARDLVIEPDLSNAAPFLAAALVAGGSVTVPDWPATTSQIGDRLREVLAAMGASVSLDEDGLTVTGNGEISGLDDLRDIGELAPVLAALAALASTPSTFRGIAHLRGHETDRLTALADDINGLGGDVTVTADGLEIQPRPLHGGRWRSYADHRMAQAGALIGLVVDGVEVDDIATTSKTLPDFPGMWSAMLTER